MFPLSIELATILWQLVHLWRQWWPCWLLSPARPQNWRLWHLESWRRRRINLPLRLTRRSRRKGIAVRARLTHTCRLNCSIVNWLWLRPVRLRHVEVVRRLDGALRIHVDPRVLAPPTSDVLRRILQCIPRLLTLIRELLMLWLSERDRRTLHHLVLRVRLRWVVLGTWVGFHSTCSII